MITLAQVIQAAGPAALESLGFPNAKPSLIVLQDGTLVTSLHLMANVHISPEMQAAADNEGRKIALATAHFEKLAKIVRDSIPVDPRHEALEEAVERLLNFIRAKYPDDFVEGGRGFVCPHHLELDHILRSLEQ